MNPRGGTALCSLCQPRGDGMRILDAGKEAASARLALYGSNTFETALGLGAGLSACHPLIAPALRSAW
jgi:hypothetical protein